MGAESKGEFDEGFAPNQSYGELLGHSLYFYSKDTGKPVRFTAPSFALKDITRIPRYRDIQATDHGCRFWWFEYGGRHDTIHETEHIKWELWKVAYGVWDYIKNSGQFPEAETMTLEWVGTIPGKRESRRFEGDVILSQRDLVEQRVWPDAVSFGGWAMDLHPADGVYSSLSGCTQWHSKGVYQIPWRTMYSRNIRNLFLAGRLISVSHVAFGSTRVMATCAHNGQAVGMAAALCRKRGVQPRDVPMGELQQELLKTGHYIPGAVLREEADLAQCAIIGASSCLELDHLAPCSSSLPLDASRAMLLPVSAGDLPVVTFLVNVLRETTLYAEVRGSMRPGNFTPDDVLHRRSFHLQPGSALSVRITPQASVASNCYAAYCLLQNPNIEVHLSDLRLTGVLSLSQSMNKAVAKGAKQEPPPGIGIDHFEFWLPSRRPGGKNLSIHISPALRCFAASNVRNGLNRPTTAPNTWIADPADIKPRLTLRWPAPITLGRVELFFDVDFDHPLESLLMGHPERNMPFCVKRYLLLDDAGRVLYECFGNHQARNSIVLPSVQTCALHVEVLETHGAPPAIFAVRCYGS